MTRITQPNAGHYSNMYTKFISVINQLDAQNVCFTISLFHVSTCFEHMCSSSGGQNCITESLVSSQLQVAVSCICPRNAALRFSYQLQPFLNRSRLPRLQQHEVTPIMNTAVLFDQTHNIATIQLLRNYKIIIYTHTII